jgi:hypothetical protein
MPDADKYSTYPDKFRWKSVFDQMEQSLTLEDKGEFGPTVQSRLQFEQVYVRTELH